MRPLGKTSTQWSPDLAYAVGLLATDGGLSIDGRHIDFTSKDLDLVETLRKCLGLQVRIAEKSSGIASNNKCYHVQFGDVLFYRWLMSIGITPRKSKTIGSLKIPSPLFFDFLRGSFDGDGTVYSYWDSRWHSSFMFYISFASASRCHLEWLNNCIYQYAGVRGRVALAARCFMLRFAKHGSLQLFHKMYYSNDAPKLERKFQKLLRIIATDQEHKQNTARVVKLVNT